MRVTKTGWRQGLSPWQETLLCPTVGAVGDVAKPTLPSPSIKCTIKRINAQPSAQPTESTDGEPQDSRTKTALPRGAKGHWLAFPVPALAGSFGTQKRPGILASASAYSLRLPGIQFQWQFWRFRQRLQLRGSAGLNRLPRTRFLIPSCSPTLPDFLCSRQVRCLGSWRLPAFLSAPAPASSSVTSTKSAAYHCAPDEVSSVVSSFVSRSSIL